MQRCTEYMRQLEHGVRTNGQHYLGTDNVKQCYKDRNSSKPSVKVKSLRDRGFYD